MAKKQISSKESAQAAKALEVLFASDYVNKKKLYYENFIRGVFFGTGSFLGATLGVALVIWVLSLFGHVPLIGGFVQDIKDTVNSQSK